VNSHLGEFPLVRYAVHFSSVSYRVMAAQKRHFGFHKREKLLAQALLEFASMMSLVVCENASLHGCTSDRLRS